MKFEDLVFKPTNAAYYDGVFCEVRFANGYGASIIKTTMSYGGKQGLYELAVLKGEDICYDTPVASDVLGWLSESDVTDTLQKIEAL